MIAFLKGELLAVLAALGLAISIFAGFDPFLDLCAWLQPIIYYWKFYTYEFWATVFYLMPFVPRNIFDVFNLIVFMVVLGFRIGAQMKYLNVLDGAELFSSGLSGKFNFYRKTVLLPVLFVSVFILFPVFGWSLQDSDYDTNSTLERIDRSLGAMPIVVKGMAVAILVTSVWVSIFLDEYKDSVIYGTNLAARILLSRHLWRVTMIIFALIGLNFVGLRVDEIRSIKMPVPPGIEIDSSVPSDPGSGCIDFHCAA